jgi:CDP-diacylglycerol--glycerol-3-phosphate 3-phosphatidyltransferase
MSRLIPEGYTLLERRFHASVVKAGREWDGHRGVRLQEWERDGWTYHAKGKHQAPTHEPHPLLTPTGLWLSPTAEPSQPFMTFIGSSNLSTRSLNLDTELSLLLSTASPVLRGQLADELKTLHVHAHDVGSQTWKLDERRVSWSAKALVALGVEGML